MLLLVICCGCTAWADTCPPSLVLRSMLLLVLKVLANDHAADTACTASVHEGSLHNGAQQADPSVYTAVAVPAAAAAAVSAWCLLQCMAVAVGHGGHYCCCCFCCCSATGDYVLLSQLLRRLCRRHAINVSKLILIAAAATGITGPPSAVLLPAGSQRALHCNHVDMQLVLIDVE